MKLHEITIEMSGQKIRLYREGDSIVSCLENTTRYHHKIDDQFWIMAESVAKRAGIQAHIDDLDILQHMLADLSSEDL